MKPVLTALLTLTVLASAPAPVQAVTIAEWQIMEGLKDGCALYRAGEPIQILGEKFIDDEAAIMISSHGFKGLVDDRSDAPLDLTIDGDAIKLTDALVFNEGGENSTMVMLVFDRADVYPRFKAPIKLSVAYEGRTIYEGTMTITAAALLTLDQCTKAGPQS